MTLLLYLLTLSVTTSASNLTSLYSRSLRRLVGPVQVSASLALENVSSSLPPPSSSLTFDDLSSVSTGMTHAAATSREGDLYVWGSNRYGQCCRPIVDESSSSLPPPPPPLPPQASSREGDCRQRQSSSIYSDCKSTHEALESMESLESSNGSGALVYPSPSSHCHHPSSVTRLSFSSSGPRTLVAGVACGAHHTLLWCSNGNLYAWGRNSSGQLGQNDLLDRHAPTLVEFTAEKMVMGACGGKGHTLVLTLSGAVYSFGRASEGQLGQHACVFSFFRARLMKASQ